MRRAGFYQSFSVAGLAVNSGLTNNYLQEPAPIGQFWLLIKQPRG
jgi:hypothetical protein